MKTEKTGTRMKKLNVLTMAGLFIAALVFSGCADVKINVHRHLFKPDIPAAVAGFYKGKQIDLNGFTNQDQGTKVWTYFSPDKKIAYEAAVPLEYFLVDCFRDAFWLAEMSVVKDSPIATIPDLSVIIDRWTDQEFKFTASVTMNNVLKFRNQYVVTMPPSNINDRAQLEKSTYTMVNKAIVALMSDPKFQAAVK